MALRNRYALTFVLKVWLDPTEKEREAVRWRGDICHVSSGRTVYFDGLERISEAVERLIELAEN